MAKNTTAQTGRQSPTKAAPEVKEQRAVQSVEFGGRLLLALADSSTASTLKELAARAGMTPSRAHPYLVSYARLGLVEQNAMSGQYALGPAALRIGLACLRRLDSLQAAEPVARELSEKTGHAVALSVWGNFGPTVVKLLEARQPLQASLRVGSVLSIFDTATGRAFAAHLPLKNLRQAVAGPLGELLPAAALEARLGDLDTIRKEFEDHGINRSLGRPIPGLNSFSAVAYDLDGAPAIVLAISDYIDNLDGSWRNPSITALRTAARTVTEKLGGPGG